MRRLFRLPIRTAADARADADAELAAFLDERVDDLVARGMDPAAARDEALRRLGGHDAARRRLRHSATRREDRARLRDTLERVAQDVRFAARQLARAPGFTIVCAITLALGVGATTAIFSAVHPVLFAPLPYPRADRVVAVWDRAADGAHADATFGTYRELAARARSLGAVAAARPWQPTLVGRAEPERLDGQRVTASWFRALGVAPALGRAFTESEDLPNTARVVVLSDALWRRRFGADPAVVGRRVTLDGDPVTVVGVMPASFESVLAPSAELWAPLRYDPALPRDGKEWGHHLRLVARLRDGVDRAAAARELDAIARTPLAEFPRAPWASLDRGLSVTTLRDEIAGGARPALVAVLGAVALLLAIACVNVTSLLLARGARRRGELALRAVIGAGRGRILRQLLTESLLLASLGGLLGVALAPLGVRALVALAPAGLPRVGAIRVDGAVLAFALALTTLVGVVVGLVPALRATGGGAPNDGLHLAARRVAGGHHSARRALVVAELALALVLLVGTGLLLRSLDRLLAVDPGFDPARTLTLQVQTSGPRYLRDDEATRRFFAAALDAVRRVPGVVDAALTSQLPLTGDEETFGVQLESGPSDDGEDRGARRATVTPGYFEAMRIPLRRGRTLDARDAAGAPSALVVSESFARRRFPGRDPVGQRARVGGMDHPWYTIVGVVADVRHASLAAGRLDAVYVTPPQWYLADRAMTVVVRARDDAASLAPAVRAAVWSVDRDQPVVRVATMERLVADSAGERRFALTLFEAFALVALALAAVGVYGVLAGGVAERTREIGVRAALGASRGAILGRVLGDGTTLAAWGVALGLVGAAAASRALASLLFGVSPLDPATYLAVGALLLGVAVAACAVPAWRASRVDPSEALRAE